MQKRADEERRAHEQALIDAGTSTSTDPRVRLGMMPCIPHPRFAEVSTATFSKFMASEHSPDFEERIEAPAYYSSVHWWFNTRALAHRRQTESWASPRDHIVAYRALIDGYVRCFVWAPWVNDPFRT